MYCPRVAYYLRCLPNVRPTTYRMRSAVEAHEDEADRERRRGLRTYGLEDGARGRRERPNDDRARDNARAHALVGPLHRLRVPTVL